MHNEHSLPESYFFSFITTIVIKTSLTSIQNVGEKNEQKSTIELQRHDKFGK